MASTGSSVAGELAAGQFLAQLFQVLDDMYVANLCTAASIAWLGFDILLTLPKEVSLIWGSKWSPPKVLYLVVRYYTLLSLTIVLAVMTNTGVTDSGWLWYFTYNGTLLTAILGDGVFLMRLYASYQHNTPIIILICALYATEVIVGVVGGTMISSSVQVMKRPPGVPLPGCLFTPEGHTTLGIASWSVAVVVTCIYFILILNKFAYNVTIFNHTASGIPVWELRRISPLVYSFLRDSAFYFLMVFAGNLLNLLFSILLQGRALEPMGASWLAAIYAISASRLSLNTRHSVRRRQSSSPHWIGGVPWADESSGDEIELHARTTFATLPSPASPVRVQPPTPDSAGSPFSFYDAHAPPRKSGVAVAGAGAGAGSRSGHARGSLSSFVVLARPGEPDARLSLTSKSAG